MMATRRGTRIAGRRGIKSSFSVSGENGAVLDDGGWLVISILLVVLAPLDKRGLGLMTDGEA